MGGTSEHFTTVSEAAQTAIKVGGIIKGIGVGLGFGGSASTLTGGGAEFGAIGLIGAIGAFAGGAIADEGNAALQHEAALDAAAKEEFAKKQQQQAPTPAPDPNTTRVPNTPGGGSDSGPNTGSDSGSESGSESGGTEEGGCFIGDTRVLMADGMRAPISAIAVGDQVMARDETTGATAACAVTRIFRHYVGETLMLQVGGGEAVETTSVHRFTTNDGGFVGAGRLRPGDKLVTYTDPAVEVVTTESRKANATVYNLTVDRLHTFFVGDSALWVHNLKDADEPIPPGGGEDP